MRERYPGMLAGKGETPRSARLPQRTAAGAVALEQDQQRVALAARVVVSVQRGSRQLLLRHTVAVAVAVLLRQA